MNPVWQDGKKVQREFVQCFVECKCAAALSYKAKSVL